MSNDDSDKDGLGRDGQNEDRSTDAVLPSEHLIEKSRRSVSRQAPLSSSYPQPMRMQGTVPGLLTPAKKLIFTLAIIFAFLLGLAISKIYYTGQMLELERKTGEVEKRMGTCEGENKRCLGELRSCVNDVDALTKTATDPSLIPRNFLVERTRKRRDTVQEDYNELLEKILERVESVKSLKRLSRKEQVALEADIQSLRQLGVDLEKAKEEYTISVVKTSNEPTGMSNPELLNRNKARAEYLSKGLEKESSENP